LAWVTITVHKMDRAEDLKGSPALVYNRGYMVPKRTLKRYIDGCNVYGTHDFHTSNVFGLLLIYEMMTGKPHYKPHETRHRWDGSNLLRPWNTSAQGTRQNTAVPSEERRPINGWHKIGEGDCLAKT